MVKVQRLRDSAPCRGQVASKRTRLGLTEEVLSPRIDIVSASSENLEKFIRELHRLTTYVKTPFDGDMMTGELILDNATADGFETLAPHYGIHDTLNPGTIRHIADLPSPTVQTIANFIASEVMVI
ncbi:RNA polymerase beta prime subunit [Vibrio phage vB_pir03]|nr:RNA polymerase beta prime subunit [Vibrio phage vB_pir03]